MLRREPYGKGESHLTPQLAKNLKIMLWTPSVDPKNASGHMSSGSEI
jgi:hypothetical protein